MQLNLFIFIVLTKWISEQKTQGVSKQQFLLASFKIKFYRKIIIVIFYKNTIYYAPKKIYQSNDCIGRK